MFSLGASEMIPMQVPVDSVREDQASHKDKAVETITMCEPPRPPRKL